MPKAILPRRTTTPTPVVRDFYVYDPTAKFVGGTKVREVDGDRIVSMTDADARYWIDNSFIGSARFSERSATAQGLIAQMTGVTPSP